ncbi:MAG: response regulator transcription factor [Bacteroidales bacterium]|nr:response regulator transcription factor [Bacteroidales bacterium]
MNKETNTNPVKVLLAEDDKNLGTILKSYLQAKGYPTTLCPNGQVAYEKFIEGSYDFCIVDIMMPVKDGFTLAKEIREVNKNVPLLFLTAKSMQEDKLKGFEIGADDYITKPFSMEELLVRMQAILRRTTPTLKDQTNNVYSIGKLTFDYTRQVLKSGDTEQKLTSKESELLKLLCENINDVLDRSFALKKIWLDDSYFNARSMDVYVTKLRKYLRSDPGIELMNVHGIGFKLVVNS